MKKKIFILISVLVLNFVFAEASFAVKKPVFSLITTNVINCTGKDFTLELSGSDLKDLYAFEAKISYPQDKVKLVKASTSLDGFTVSPIKEGNHITFAFTKIGKKTGENGNVKLARFTFNTATSSAVLFNIDSVKTVNSKLESSTYTTAGSLSLFLKKPKDNVSNDFTIAAILKSANIFPASKINLKFTGKVENWEKGYIQAAVNKKFITVNKNTFVSSPKLTRAQLAVIALKAFGQKESKTKLKVSDAKLIPAASSGYVAKALEIKAFYKYPDNTFRPNLNVTVDALDFVINKLLSIKK